MRASRILPLARTSRCAIVASGTRKARAISAVASPPRSRSVSATCAARPSAGWQQVKMSRSRSSGTGPSSSGSSPAWSSAACSVAVGARGLAAQAVDRPAARGGDDPAGRARRQAVGRPPLDGRDEGVRDRVLGDAEVAEDAGEDRDRAAVLGAEHALDLLRADRVHRGLRRPGRAGTAAPRPAGNAARGLPCGPSRARRRGRRPSRSKRRRRAPCSPRTGRRS